jgi:hypothetical protein
MDENADNEQRPTRYGAAAKTEGQAGAEKMSKRNATGNKGTDLRKRNGFR